MNNYELTIVCKPELDEKQTDKIVDDLDCEVVSRSQWGKRLLAYPIQKFQEAIYVHTVIAAKPENVAKIDQTLIRNNDILRHLLVTATPVNK